MWPFVLRRFQAEQFAGSASLLPAAPVSKAAAAAAAVRRRRRGSRLGSGHAVAAVGVPAERDPRTGRGRAGQLPAALRSA